MGTDKFNNKDFSMDMNKYLDKKSKSSSRFLNLHDSLTGSKTVSVETETEIVHIKSTTPFGYFINKIKDFFASDKKDEDEEVTLEDIEDVEQPKVQEEIVQESEEDDEEDEESKTKGSSFWSKIVAFFKSEAGDDDELEEQDEYDDEISEEEDMKSDMKKITVFTKKVLKKLPREEFQQLKHTGELEEFKIILRKHKIIK